MEHLWWFYAIGLVILIIPNAIAIGKGRRISSNAFQIICYLGVMIIFMSLDNTSGLTEEFFFTTGLIFLVTFIIELLQFATKTRASFWGNLGENFLDICFLILSVVPIICTLGFLSGLFIF